MDIGAYWRFCFISSVTRWPRSSWARVAASRSEANWAKAASSRNCARASFTPPESFFTILVWAAPPTRDTRYRRSRPADAGVEQVGLEEDLAVGDRDHVGRHEGRTSPAWVSMIGSAVSEPVLPLTAPLVNFSTYSSGDARGAPRAGASAGRTRRPDRLRGPADDAAAARSGGRPRPVGQIVVDDQGVFAAVAEVLAHGAARVGRDVLQRGRFERPRRRRWCGQGRRFLPACAPRWQSSSASARWPRKCT